MYVIYFYFYSPSLFDLLAIYYCDTNSAKSHFNSCKNIPNFKQWISEAL